MTESAKQRRNPYVGPRAFRAGEKLYGRNTETQKLYHLLMAERIVLLHAPSGAGKTSLVEAGLIPKFRRDGFRVWPSTNLKRHSSSALSNPDANIYALSILSSLEEEVDPSERLPLDELASLSLCEYLDRVSDASLQADELLIFDQFEDIVRVDPDDRAGKMAFFEQVGEVLKARNRWALFAMREEYLGALEPYLRAVPSRLEYRFRLNLLDEVAAAEAIREPAKDEDVTFAEGTIPKLVENLKGISDGVERHPYVEPVHLQVVCRSLWNKLPPDTSVFTAEMLGTLNDVDSALSEYYSTGVAEASKASGVDEGEIRDWFEARLMTADGVRRQTRAQPGAAEHSKAVVDTLEDVFLVRTEDRHGFRWMELAHDRLVEPILANNSEWRTKNLSAFQQKARLWDELGRPRGELLVGRQLKGGRAWAAKRTQPLSQVEDAFLRSCNDEASVRRTRRVWSGAVIGTAMFVLVSVGSYMINEKAEREETERLERVIDNAVGIMALDPELSLLLSLEAFADGAGESSALANAPLANLFWDGIEQNNVYRAMHGHHGAVEDLVFAPLPEGNERLISAGNDGMINVWDPDSGRETQTLLFHTSPVRGLAVSPDGNVLASVDEDGAAALWRLRPDGRGYEFSRTFTAHIATATAVAFSGDGSRLATAGNDGSVHIWGTETGGLERSLPQQVLAVHRLSFGGPQGSLLATGDDEGWVRVWDSSTGRLEWEVSGGRTRIMEVQFSPNGSRLAAATAQGAVRVWDVVSREVAFEYGAEGALALAFSPDGSLLATSTATNQIRIWARNWDTGNWEESRTLIGRVGTVEALAFSADSATLASADETDAIRLWPLSETSAFLTSKLKETALSWLELSQDGEELLAADRSGGVGIWAFSALGEADAPAESFEFEEGAPAPIFSVSPDGRHVAMASGTVAGLWTRGAPAERMTLRENEVVEEDAEADNDERIITSVEFDPGSSWVVIGDASGDLDFRSIADGGGKPVVRGGHSSPVRDIVFSSDGSLLISGDQEGNVALSEFDVPAFAQAGDVEPKSLLNRGAIAVLAMDQAGERLLVGSELQDGRGLLTMWSLAELEAWDSSDLEDAQRPQPLYSAIALDSAITDLSFDPTGQYFVSSDAAGAVRIWDSASGLEERRFEDSFAASSVRFHPSGAYVVAGRADGTVRLHALSFEGLAMQARGRVHRSLRPRECASYLERECPPPSPRDELQAARAAFFAGDEVAARQRLELAARGDATIDLDAEVMRWALPAALIRARDLAGEAQRGTAWTDLAAEDRTVLEFPLSVEGSALGPDVDTAGNRFLASAWLREGVRLVGEDNLVEAAALLTAAAELNPELGLDPKARLRQLAAVASARSSRAMGGDQELLESAVAMDATNADWIYLLGRELYDDEDYLESGRAFAKAARLQPDRAEFYSWYAYSALGRIHRKQASGLRISDEEFERAEAAALSAIEMQIKDGFATEALAQLSLARGEPAEALALLDTVSRNDLQYESATMLAGSIQFDYPDTRDYSNAYRIFSFLAERNPDSGSYLANVAEASLATGRFQEAFDLASDLLEYSGIYGDLRSNNRRVMVFLKLAASLLLERDDAAVTVLREFSDEYTGQPANWSFGGTRAFICDRSMPRNEQAFLLWMMTVLEGSISSETAETLERYLRDGLPGASDLVAFECGRQ